jgi:CO/xanthine dehydrogenase Mo-binding subunit
MPDELVPIVVEVPHPDGPFGAKGVGESGLLAVSPAVANAVEAAVGVRIRDLPITPEKILRALANRAGLQ